MINERVLEPVQPVDHDDKLFKKDSPLLTLFKEIRVKFRDDTYANTDRKNVKFKEYITLLFNFLDIDESASGKVKYISDLINKYESDFIVAFTDKDYDKNVLSNYELFEYLGDRNAWSIFTNYIAKKFPNITSNDMTNYHQIYAAEDFQAELSNRLCMYKFLRKRGRIDAKTQGDIFEVVSWRSHGY